MTSRLNELVDAVGEVNSGADKVRSIRLGSLIEAIDQRFEEAK